MALPLFPPGGYLFTSFASQNSSNPHTLWRCLPVPVMSNTCALDQTSLQSKFELTLGLVKCMEYFLEGKEPENLQLN
jgi:hypothetical protein